MNYWEYIFIALAPLSHNDSFIHYDLKVVISLAINEIIFF